MQSRYLPQWLKEVLERGFRPEKHYQNFNDSMFGYISRLSHYQNKFPNKKIFVLEGLPGTGKTTISKNFIKDKNIIKIDQILPLIPKYDQAMPSSFYCKSEELKTKKILKSNKNLFLLDRYYTSTLAFYWAYDKTYGTKKYPKIFNWYVKAIKKGSLIKPFLIFYIKVRPKLSLIRKGRSSNLKSHDVWVSSQFLHYFNAYYPFFYRTIEPQTHCIILSGSQSLNKLNHSIKSCIYDKR